MEWLLIHDGSVDVQARTHGARLVRMTLRRVLDEFDSPHVQTANLDQVKAIIRVTMSTAMLEVPADQSLITQYFG